MNVSRLRATISLPVGNSFNACEQKQESTIKIYPMIG